MGLAKSLWMEMEETEWEESDVVLFCPKCEDDVDGTTELPVVYDNGDSCHLPVSVQCSDCDESYDGWVKTDWYDCEIKLDDHPNVQVIAEPAQRSANSYDDYDQEYFDWLEQQEPISRPIYRAFCNTISDVKSVTTLSPTNPQQAQMLARMLLAQSITALEVYLADTLILTVANSKDAQKRLLRSKDLEIGNVKFSLADAIGVEDFSKVRLIQHLRAVSFHDLKKVRKLYRVGIGIDIATENEEFEQIQKAVTIRHDCVHRNGACRETGEVHQIDQQSLLSLTDTLLKVVRSVDEQVDDFGSVL